MKLVIERNDGQYFAGIVQEQIGTGFVWTSDVTEAATFDSWDTALVNARTVLHAALDVPLDEPGAIPRDSKFDVEIVDLEAADE